VVAAVVPVECLRIGVHAMIRRAVTLIADDSGQDLVEYALLAGLIGVVGAAILPAIAEQMGVAYNSWLSGAEAIWEPPAPGS
jgi:Flp pilus assembly pilin Flp